MLEGEKVYLDTIEENDLEQLRYWRNLSYYKKHFREYREINQSMQKRWFENQVCNDDRTIMFAIRDIKTQELLGCCGLCYINWVQRNADLSLYIGRREAYIDDEGFAEESCRLLFDYGFNELNLHKIWTEIYIFDEKKKVLYDKMGMKTDGLFRDNCYYNGKWWDAYLMSILQEEYQSKEGN